MLVLAPGDAGYPDDVDPAVRYRLPVGLRPTSGPDGVPEVVLSRSENGGLLHVRLAAVWPALAPHERPVPFAEGRFRLLLQTPASRETGAWWPTPVIGEAVVHRSVTLDATEAAIARHVGLRTDDLVDVEVELRVRGLAPTYPWLVSVDPSGLRSRLAALLRRSPASWDDVQAAFLGLSADTFTWYPLEPRAIPPPLDAALLSIAHHAAPLLFTSTPGGWLLADAPPARTEVSLNVPRISTAWVGFEWSFSEFLVTQPDPSRHLVDVTVPAPFEAAPVTIVNDLPLAPEGIRSIAVEVRTGGPSGLLRHEFLPGEPSAVRLRFIRETFDALSLEWRAQYTVMTAAGPAVSGFDFRPCGQLIEVNADALGLQALRVQAAPDVFAHVAALEVTVGARTLVLTQSAPAAWVVGRRPPPSAAVLAVLASGARHPLGHVPIGPLGLSLDGSALGIGEQARVLLALPPNVSPAPAYVAVQVEHHPWRTVDQDAAVAVGVRRETRFEPPRFRYRTRHVPRDASGATRIIAESPWRDGVGDAVQIEL